MIQFSMGAMVDRHVSVPVQLASTRKISFIIFFNAPATTDIYTLSLHDALPISTDLTEPSYYLTGFRFKNDRVFGEGDRKSTRLNSSHVSISYAVFCLKKKINVTGRDTHLSNPAD